MIYNVKDYGAKGDGIADDKLAIQKAINDASAAGGGVVYLPTGTYTVSGNAKDAYGCIQLKNNVTVEGDGMGETIIKLQDGWDKKVTGIVRTQVDVINHDIVLRDLSIDGNKAHNTGETDAFFTGVQPGSAAADYNILVERVEVHDVSRFGFDPHEQTVNLVIRDSVAHDTGHSGFVADYQSFGSFENNVSYNNGSHGFNIVTSTHDFVLKNNIAYGNGENGIVIQRGGDDRPLTDNILIQGGQYYDNGLEGILVKISTDVMVQDAEVYSNGTFGIRLMGAKDNVIVGNHVYDNSQSTLGKFDGISLGQYDDTHGPSGKLFGAVGNIVAENTVDGGQGAYGIREVYDSSTGNLLVDNDITGGLKGVTSLLHASQLHLADLTPDVLAKLNGAAFSTTPSLYGSEGIDLLVGKGVGEMVYAYGGDDTVKAGGGADVVDGAAGKDTLYGNDGNDTLSGGADNDVLYGGADHDMLYGGAGNDKLSADSGNDYLEGGDGDDQLIGDEGDDILIGGAGTDKLNAGAGNDYLYGGAGNDSLWGGDGADRFVFTHDIGRNSVRDFQEGTDKLDLTAYGFSDFDTFIHAVSVSGSTTKTLITFDATTSVEVYGLALGHLDATDVIL